MVELPLKFNKVNLYGSYAFELKRFNYLETRIYMKKEFKSPAYLQVGIYNQEAIKFKYVCSFIAKQLYLLYILKNTFSNFLTTIKPKINLFIPLYFSHFKLIFPQPADNKQNIFIVQAELNRFTYQLQQSFALAKNQQKMHRHITTIYCQPLYKVLKINAQQKTNDCFR